MLMGNLEAWKGRGGNLGMPAVRQIHTLGLPTYSSLERGLGKGSRLPCYVFCIFLLTTNKYQKYKSVKLGDQLTSLPGDILLSFLVVSLTQRLKPDLSKGFGAFPHPKVGHSSV